MRTKKATATFIEVQKRGVPRMMFIPCSPTGPDAQMRVCRIVVLLSASAVLLPLTSAQVLATDHRNFSAWKNENKNEQVRKQRSSSLESGRGFFDSLFSFRRSRLLDQDEIRSRLSAEPKKKPAFYTYKPEPQVPLASRDLVGHVGEAPLAANLFGLMTSSDANGLRTLKDDVKAIRAGYAARKFEPIWVTKTGFKPSTISLLSALSAADQEGLDARRYLPATLGSFDETSLGDLNDDALARLELELTISALAYAREASAGRLVPNRIGRNFDVKPAAVNPATALNMLIESNRPGRVLNRLHPSHPAYLAMKRELAKLRTSLNAADQQSDIPDGKTLRLALVDARVPLIRIRLKKLGYPVKQLAVADTVPADFDLSSVPVQVKSENQRERVSLQTYDQHVADAVKKFQRSNGLRPDGLLGRRTLAALNKKPPSTEVRITQLKIGMERLRWLPRSLGKRHIIVNKPAYVARVIDNGKTTHKMRVVVGKPRFATPEFYDQMEHVVFNPYWNVPRSIAGNEMLPKLWNDPSYLDRTGYQVFNRRGRQVASSSVDWWSYTGRTMPYDIRQPPGRRNALGAVKFMFPNKHAIYMHDTPAKNLFDRLTRAYSHGCVRVQTPRKFAQIVLGWNKARVDAAISSGENRKVSLSQNIPVYLTYFTAWPDESGAMKYYEDVYGRDRAMVRALQTLNRKAAQS